VVARIEEISYFSQSIKRTKDRRSGSHMRRVRELEEDRVPSRRRRADC
jgi:hypothetical protein